MPAAPQRRRRERASAPAGLVPRRLHPGDAAAFERFVMGLSPASRRLRFHGALNACPPALLRYLTQLDHVRHQAWLAVLPRDEGYGVVGEARFVLADDRRAEFAIAVAEDQRGRGVADGLLRTLLQQAHRCGIELLFGDVLDGNVRMGRLLQRHGFRIEPGADVDPGAQRWQRPARRGPG